jgi:putative hydrolase of the HAD superfamily
MGRPSVRDIKAIGFDLFNTLITVSPECVTEAMVRLTDELQRGGLELDLNSFRQAHREAAVRFFKEARSDGRETHNRYWISSALETLGYSVNPFDPLVEKGIEAYFSSFLEYSNLIPGTIEMLDSLRDRYRLGLLSNFTHPPAADLLLKRLGLPRFFESIVISGQVGFCKPHPKVFEIFLMEMGVEGSEVLFIGDDPEADIMGAAAAGLRPVWTTYVRDNNLPHAVSAAVSSYEDPDESVARISSWEDLFSILSRGGGKGPDG